VEKEMGLVVFIAIYFAGKAGAYFINVLSKRTVISDLRAAGLVTLFAAAIAWGFILLSYAPPGATPRQAGEVIGERVLTPVLLIVIGVMIAAWWRGRRSKTRDAAPGNLASAGQAPAAKKDMTLQRIGLFLLAFVVVGGISFGMQFWKARLPGNEYKSAGFPDARSYQVFMAEWAKVMALPEFKAWAASLKGEAAYKEAAKLTADGLPRISGVDLVDRERIFLAVMQSQDATFCAQLVTGDVMDAQASGPQLLAAIAKAGGEDAMKTWGRFSADAAIASLRQDQKPKFSEEQANTIMTSLLAPLPQPDQKQLLTFLTHPETLSDRQKCDAGISLYQSALALPQEQRETAARFLVAD
jgi:hypothetical protein